MMRYILGPFGERVSLLNPFESPLLIRTIARSLARLPRYTSHTKGRVYSVGQHSIGASYLVAPSFQKEALLHDASETYLNDLSSPVKAMCPDYRALEDRFDLAIAERYDLPRTRSPCVKIADLIMLATEKRDLMPYDPEEWEIIRGIIPMKKRISPHWHWKYTEWLFLRRFEELTR